MIKGVRLYAVVGASMLVLSGCTTGRSTIDASSGLADMQSLQATLEQTGSGPSVEQYQSVRQSFVSAMTDIMVQQARQSRTPAKKIKNTVTAAGVVLSMGGTIASLVIDDEDTRAAIAQASGGIASISGIISLLPFGSGSEHAESVNTYLTAELPLFEARWPSDVDEPLTAEGWAFFVRDVEHISGLVEQLSK